MPIFYPARFRSELVAYGCSHPEELSIVERYLALLTSVVGIGRECYSPGHFTASAFILSPDHKSLLLVEHLKLNRWLQPGGHIERSDNCPESAARREVHEETGLWGLALLSNGIFDLDIHTIPARKNEPEHQHFDVRYLFRAPPLPLEAGSDAGQARFVPLAEAATLNTSTSVPRVLEKIAAHLRNNMP